jgi:eukaryotic-like serine/threonine-protein kinase
VYAVGILLYQMLTGSLPFDGTSDQICLDHWNMQPLAPSLLNPALARPVERVILCAMEKEPCHRYQTIADVLHAFQKAIEAPTFFKQLSLQWQATCQKLELICH